MSLQPTANTKNEKTNGSILRSHALNLHVSDQMFKNTHSDALKIQHQTWSPHGKEGVPG